ncbi:hypothetical protein PC116_g33691 [Phytophthora cactorum]|nr:hypothetical protein PC116_g33691 [Phytophthora cactorum]
MASNNGVTIPEDTAASKAEETVQTKGKGKAAEEQVDTAMDEDDDDDDEEEEGEGGKLFSATGRRAYYMFLSLLTQFLLQVMTTPRTT